MLNFLLDCKHFTTLEFNNQCNKIKLVYLPKSQNHVLILEAFDLIVFFEALYNNRALRSLAASLIIILFLSFLCDTKSQYSCILNATL